jgi:hypothetical protein
MIIINHRVNTIEALKNVPTEYGIEVDIRYHENELILSHDPFNHHKEYSEKFETLLMHWHHDGPLILNIKTEGIEAACIQLMTEYKIKNWFFLDLSMPCFAKYAYLAGDSNNPFFSVQNLAVRFSEREVIEYALAFKDKVKWVWVDCFTQLVLNQVNYQLLKKAGFNICLVSPELQHHPITYIQAFKDQLISLDIDAVCTKHPDLWKTVLM